MNRDSITRLASWFVATDGAFPADVFVDEAVERFGELQLLARIDHVARALRRFLPTTYPEAVARVLASLPPPLDPERTDGDSGDWAVAPLARLIAIEGCRKADLDASLDALRVITMRFTAEFAVRPFINAYPDQTLHTMLEWSHDANYHVRRLASEGSRPRLPWSGSLSVPPTWGLPILDHLHADPTRYVTRSVANHVNDISRVEPDVAVNRILQWRDGGRQRPSEMAFIARHGLRSLTKAGHSAALAARGFEPNPQLDDVTVCCHTPTVELGAPVEYRLSFVSRRTQALAIDYRLHFARPDERASSKVFKLHETKANAGERVVIEKRHPMRRMTTRALHAGHHVVEILINGRGVAEFVFDLVMSET